MVSPAGFEPATPGLEVPAHRVSTVVSRYHFLRKPRHINVSLVSLNMVFIIRFIIFQS